MDVVVESSAWSEILDHARNEYPDECCGFLVGSDRNSRPPAGRSVLRTIPARNRSSSTRSRRYLITSEDLLRVEQTLDGTDQAVVGFYHSHPDHPARPSEYDRDHAWPWYTYVVLAVRAGAPGDAGAFELDENSGEFRRVRWRIRNAPARQGSNGAHRAAKVEVA